MSNLIDVNYVVGGNKVKVGQLTLDKLDFWATSAINLECSSEHNGNLMIISTVKEVNSVCFNAIISAELVAKMKAEKVTSLTLHKCLFNSNPRYHIKDSEMIIE